MSIFRLAGLTAAASALALPASAATPEEVWENWQTFLTESYAAEVEVSEARRSGETLIISDITVTSEGDGGSVEMALDELSFENIGNGSVRIRMPDRIPIATAFTLEDGETGFATMALTQSGGTLIASGPVDRLRYDFDYAAIGLGDLDVSGGDMPEGGLPVTMGLSMTAFEGFFEITDADSRAYDSQTRAADLSLDMSFADPGADEPSTGTFSLTIADLDQTTRGTIGRLTPGASLSELVTSGTTQDGTATHGAATYSFAMEGPDGTFEMAAAAAGGVIEGLIGPEGLVYSGTSRDITMTFGGSAIPLPPVTLRIAENGGMLRMPIVPGPDPQPFGLKLSLVGLEIDDMLWSLFDPGAALPRDPATLILDLSGTGVLTSDFTDPEFADSPEAMEAPGELQSLSINELLLSLAGAELTGEGAATFSSEGGIPMPIGAITLALTGGNALLDTLVGMGLIPEEQAMGARMMLGLFARPDGEDRLISVIEFTEDGQILANGQRIR